MVCIAAAAGGAVTIWTSLRSRSTGLWLLLFCAAGMAGIGRGAVVQSRTEAIEALLPERGAGEVTGRIADVEMKYGVWNIELSEALIRRNEEWFPIGRVLLSCDPGKLPPGSEDLKLGMLVIAKGQIKTFAVPGNQGEFHSRNYYRSLGIHCKVSVSGMSVRNSKYDYVRELLHQLRINAKDILDQIAGKKESGILKAAILGDKAELEEEIRALYQRNGISHLLALSGLHLSLIGAAVYGGLRKAGAGFGTAGLCGAVLTCAYVFMTGSPVSVIRAAIMLVCSFLAAYTGRRYDLLSAWALALVLLAGHQPYLLFQSGFQLSFGAIAGIGFIYPVLASKEKGGLFQAALIGGSVHIATFPVVLYHYYQISVYGFLLNLIVIPLMGIVIASGISGIFLAGINRHLGRFAIGPVHMILGLYEWLCRQAEGLPYAVRITGCPQQWQVGIYYTGLLIVLNLEGMLRLLHTIRSGSGNDISTTEKAEQNRRIRIGLLIAIQLLLFVRLPVRGLQVTFLDVGQGDGVFLQTGYHTVLSDTGSSDVKSVGSYRLEPYLKYQGISVLDYVLISHGDSDHMNGITYLLAEGKDIAIRNLVLPAAGKTDPVFAEICRLAEERGTVLHWMEQGDSIRTGELRITCLYPAAGETIIDRNAGSLVLHVTYQEFQMLLTGDMGEAQERQLLADSQATELLPGIQVLKVAHHGSGFSSSAAWLSRMKPGWAVISCGRDNTYGHPDQGVVTRLEDQETVIFETAKSGAITLHTNGKAIVWKTFR